MTERKKVANAFIIRILLDLSDDLLHYSVFQVKIKIFIIRIFLIN